MTKKSISIEEAEKDFGIRYSGERMPNGEVRFRLTSDEENGYVVTIANEHGGWQKAHSHTDLRETYIVEKGWIASAEKRSDKIAIRKHTAGSIFTTDARISHNIYMAKKSVIHTVKHGSKVAGDWKEDIGLTKDTENLTVDDIHLRATALRDVTHFDSYIQLYNNLDRILWSVPNLLAASAAILIGFFGSLVLRQPDIQFSPSIIF